MRVTTLGHAGLAVESGDRLILIDPWFSPEGAFAGSWFQYPENSHLLADPRLLAPDAVVISHEHLDHLDPWFLAQLPAEVPVHVPAYPSPVLRRKLAAAGRRAIVESNEWEEIEVTDGIRVFFVSEPPMNHDSAIVVQAGSTTVLNLNDARLFPVQLREVRSRVGGRVDLMFFQGAGASWYPMCYEYPPHRRGELAAAKRAAKLSYCAMIMRTVEPELGVPFAGPPAFLDPELAEHNAEMDGGIFPDQGQVAQWLSERKITNTAVMLPGDSWDSESRATRRDPHWADFSFGGREAYLAAYAERRSAQVAAVRDRHPEPDHDLWPAFSSFFERLLKHNEYFNSRINMRVGFEVTGPGGGNWAVDFRADHLGVHPEIGECAYYYSFASRWLPPLLDRSTTWEDFLLSLRFRARRTPDRYNDHLLGLLKFDDASALEAVEAFETTLDAAELIEMKSEGRRYRLQRFCPHAGSDLLECGEVLPGNILRCLAHHYDFDLTTGKCLTGAGAELDVELVEDEPA